VASFRHDAVKFGAGILPTSSVSFEECQALLGSEVRQDGLD
jgi:hypothetical protein